MQSVRRDFLPAFSRCEVMNTRLPKTTGELVPQPGSLTDQRMFSVLDQRMGRLRPSATPSALGPRQRCQSAVADFCSCVKADLENRINPPARKRMAISKYFEGLAATASLGFQSTLYTSVFFLASLPPFFGILLNN